MNLSIITPVLNGEQHIAHCIRSVIKQNCPVEHLIIDGGSTDATLRIIQKYANQYNHIRFLQQPTNQSQAMNLGIKLAQGEIISFLNVDDFHEPGTLKYVQERFTTLPEPSLLVGNCNILNDQDECITTNTPTNPTRFKLLLGKKIFPHPANPTAYFYHKRIHDIVGRFDENNDYLMDLDFLLRALPLANVAYVNSILGNFRFIRGTKTYKQVRTGGNKQARKHVYEKYAKQLPLLKRTALFLALTYHYNLLPAIQEKNLQALLNTRPFYLR